MPTELKTMLAYAAPYRVALACSALLMLAESAMALAVPWLGGHLAAGMLAAQFDELSRLVSQAICYRLDYPRRFEDLVAIRQAIVEHIMNGDQA